MIVITNPLAAHLASFAPCIMAGTSSRDNVTSDGTLIQLNITGYHSGTGGRLGVTVDGAASGFEPGDTITISGATGTLTRYNGRHQVHSVGSAIVTLTTLWSGGLSASIGQITRTNDSLLVRADVYKGGTLLGTVYANTSRRSWELDVSPVLQSGHSSPFTLTPGLASALGTVYSYEVRLFEQWQRPDYSIVVVQTTLVTQIGVAHRVTSVATRTTTDLLNTSFLAGGSLIMHIMGNFYDARVRFTPSPGTATTYSVACPDGHIVVVYQIPAGARSVNVDVLNIEIGNPLKQTLVIRVPPARGGKRLYFLNRHGGYASVELVDYEVFDEVDTVERTPVKSLEVVRGSTRAEARANTVYLDGLADSPEVYDEQGRRVYLRTTKIVKWANELILDIEYERDQLMML